MTTTLPSFGLNDIPDNWDIELDADFVRFLDMVNRPWKHNPDGSFNPQGRHNPREGAPFWEAGWYSKKRKRYRKLRTPDYFRRQELFSKLWGYHRFHDAHTTRYGEIRHHDRGNWIKKADLSILRAPFDDLTDSDIEEVVVGLRKGKYSDANERAVHFPRLPIVADKHWAWLLGFYYGAGKIYFRDRYYKTKNHEASILIKYNEEVLPLIVEHTQAIGITKLIFVKKAGSYAIKKKSLGLTFRPDFVLGWPEYWVLKKFGLSTFFETEKPNDRSASRAYKPFIPNWVKENDECMESFIEGYINTVKGASWITPTRRRNSIVPGIPRPAILIRCNGRPECYVKNFLLDVQAWFQKQGINGYFRKLSRYGVPGRVQYEVGFYDKKARKFFAEHFEVRRSEFRARLFLSHVVEQERETLLFAPVYEILRHIHTPDNVLLGMIMERAQSKEEIKRNLQMHIDGITASLLRLQQTGVITFEGGKYSFDPTEWLKQLSDKKRKLLENYQLSASSLLLQCPKCKTIYMIQREKCGVCHEKLLPIKRTKILTSINVRLKQLQEAMRGRSESFKVTTMSH